MNKIKYYCTLLLLSINSYAFDHVYLLNYDNTSHGLIVKTTNLIDNNFIPMTVVNNKYQTDFSSIDFKNFLINDIDKAKNISWLLLDRKKSIVYQDKIITRPVLGKLDFNLNFIKHGGVLKIPEFLDPYRLTNVIPDIITGNFFNEITSLNDYNQRFKTYSEILGKILGGSAYNLENKKTVNELKSAIEEQLKSTGAKGNNLGELLNNAVLLSRGNSTIGALSDLSTAIDTINLLKKIDLESTLKASVIGENTLSSISYLLTLQSNFANIELEKKRYASLSFIYATLNLPRMCNALEGLANNSTQTDPAFSDAWQVQRQIYCTVGGQYDFINIYLNKLAKDLYLKDLADTFDFTLGVLNSIYSGVIATKLTALSSYYGISTVAVTAAQAAVIGAVVIWSGKQILNGLAYIDTLTKQNRSIILAAHLLSCLNEMLPIAENRVVRNMRLSDFDKIINIKLLQTVLMFHNMNIFENQVNDALFSTTDYSDYFAPNEWAKRIGLSLNFSKQEFLNETSRITNELVLQISLIRPNKILMDEIANKIVVPSIIPITPSNRQPVAKLNGGKLQAIIGEKVFFDGSKSYDLDNDPLIYNWTLISPNGSAALLTSNADNTATLRPDKQGIYEIRFSVNDGLLNSKEKKYFVKVSPPSTDGHDLAINIANLNFSGRVTNGKTISPTEIAVSNKGLFPEETSVTMTVQHENGSVLSNKSVNIGIVKPGGIVSLTFSQRNVLSYLVQNITDGNSISVSFRVEPVGAMDKGDTDWANNTKAISLWVGNKRPVISNIYRIKHFELSYNANLELRGYQINTPPSSRAVGGYTIPGQPPASISSNGNIYEVFLGPHTTMFKVELIILKNGLLLEHTIEPNRTAFLIDYGRLLLSVDADLPTAYLQLSYPANNEASLNPNEATIIQNSQQLFKADIGQFGYDGFRANSGRFRKYFYSYSGSPLSSFSTAFSTKTNKAPFNVAYTKTSYGWDLAVTPTRVGNQKIAFELWGANGRDYIVIGQLNSIAPPIDSDGDGVNDIADAFPNDKAASVDSDQDNYPDFWNIGMSELDSTTGLKLDLMPNDRNANIDSDGDLVPDYYDAFPNDINEQYDSDGDLVGDNSDPAPNDRFRFSNSIPQFVPIIDQAVGSGLLTAIAIDVNDPDGDTVFISKISGPSFINVIGNQLFVFPTINDIGIHSITVQASDNFGGQALLTITVTVSDKLPVNINFSGSGSGIVSGNSNGINCHGSCDYNLTAGSLITLNVIPDPDSIFMGWSGGGCTGTGPCTVTINGATSVTADFLKASELFDAPLETVGSSGSFGVGSRTNASISDEFGNTYIVGSAFSAWGTPLSPHNGNSDMLIAKYDKQGSLLWHTFLGGSGYDYIKDIIFDKNGNIIVIGTAEQGWGSTINGYNKPAENAYDNLLPSNILVAKLNSNGGMLWHTFLNGRGGGESIAIDNNNDIYITGDSENSWGIPLNPHSGGSDVFVAKLSESGQELWHTFFGGGVSNVSTGYDIQIDRLGTIYFSGNTSASWGNPINPYFSNSKYAWIGANLSNTFVAKLDNTGTLLWNTFFDGYTRLGFTNTRIAVDNRHSAIYLASSGNLGWGSPIRPYTDGTDANGNDGYVAKLDTNGILLWNTFLGGSGSDVIKDIALNSSGDIYISGNSSQTWGAPLSGISGNFLAKLDEAGNLLATRFVNWDLGLSVDTLDNVYLQSLTDKISIAKFGDRKYWFDYDGDLIPDKVEQSWGLDPRDPTDGGLDSDIDTYSDGIEYLANTDRSIQQSKPQGPSSGVYHLFQDDFADAVYTDRWALDRFSTNALKNNNVTEFGSQLDISIDAPIAPASCENAALDAFVAIKQPSFTVEVQNKITGSGEFCISLREVNNPVSDTFVDICAINSGAAYTIEVRSNEGGIKTLTQGQALLNDPGTVPVQWQLKKKGDAFELLTRQGAAWQSQASFVNTRFATAELRPSLSVKNCGTTTATMSIEQFSILRDTDADTIPDMTDNCPLINNPAQSDADNDNIGDACDTGDTDQDTLSDQQEFQLGTDPTKKDSEGDGLPDNWEVSMGTNPLVDDANADPDVDGFSNLQEYLAGTNPTLKTSIPSKLRFIATSYIASKIDGIVTLPVTRTGGNTGTSSVQCETVNDTALAGMDYVALNNINGWLNWADGDSSIKYCTISLIGNTIAQGRTRFTVNLVTPAKGSLVGALSMAEILLKYPTHDDFGGDGNADILIRKTNGFLAMYEMNGATRTLGAVGGLPNEWTVDGIGDFGGDGNADILIRKTNGFLAMYEMNGATRSLSAVGGLSNDWTVEGVGDFGGDGNADILIRKTNGFLAMYEMNGATRSLRAVGGLSSDWTVKGIGDFGGDGKADILIRKLNGFLAMYQMNGAVRSLIPVGGLSNDWKVKGVADFSGDGKADILIRKSNGFLAMYQMNGASRTLHPIGGLPLDWSIEQVGDFGGDGKADILIRKSNGFLAMYQMDGVLRTLNAVGGLPTAWTIQPVKQPLL
ncbi:MAG: hypothetical protein L3J75_04020 [Methylococcaceae bacterium]|nr:hypothetical protein [Methylococcaceae bacterium]